MPEEKTATRIQVAPEDPALLDFIRGEARRLGLDTGPYLRMLARAVYLNKQGDYTLASMLHVPIIFGVSAPHPAPLAPAPPPPSGPQAHIDRVDDALDDYA